MVDLQKLGERLAMIITSIRLACEISKISNFRCFHVRNIRASLPCNCAIATAKRLTYAPSPTVWMCASAFTYVFSERQYHMNSRMS